MAGDRLQQPELVARRHDRHRIQEIARLRLELRYARGDGVADAVRYLRARRGEHLAHKEWVSARAPVQLVGVDRMAGGEPADGRRGERCDGYPDHTRRRRELAEHRPERMRPFELIVPIRDRDKSRQAAQAARQKPQHVQRRLVRPMRVLDHENRRPSA